MVEDTPAEVSFLCCCQANVAALFAQHHNVPPACLRASLLLLVLLCRYMGLMTAADLQLYGVACAAGVVGVWLGDRLSYLINQQAFQQVLAVLMALCCFLMFGSGLGLIA